MTTQALALRFADWSMTDSLGKLNVNLFVRDDCPPVMATCNRSWLNSNQMLPSSLKDDVQAFFWYRNHELKNSLHIINPESIRSGEYKANPRDSLISCSLPERKPPQKTQYLTCKVNEKIRQQLRADPFQFRGEVTENCLSLEGWSRRSILYNDSEFGSGEMQIDMKFIVSGSIRWPD